MDELAVDLAQWQAGTFALMFLLAIGAAGLRMSGYVNRRAGLSLVALSLAGMYTTVAWWLWPLSPTEIIVLAAVLFIAVLASLLIARRQRHGYGSDSATGRKVVRIVDLLDSDGVLRDVERSRYVVVGPALLQYEHGSPFVHCDFDGESFPPIWVYPDSRLGSIQVENCMFTKCSFRGVAWAMREDERQELYDGLFLAQVVDEELTRQRAAPPPTTEP
jgi:hypothetical protein